ncbi:CPBP family intramembrane glutamic endopeptidase [Desertibacillus haloalkaliphilus]|uniref:CPBP family intramembrane glutamic endopeptidase n=1 Tax=Desertibacillus haloalkaliphilus TaxID=1328930 RepID=UPI001C25F86F|nr:type II CAAX endopeptidase family protein [Desertibacillus haloalkaliphilus]MBU8908557.1 CPBP family intramembrane metalloprotease [Desertibacillus haloalkaliphilus]
MPRRYWFILLTYILVQLSAIVGAPLLLLLDVPREQIPGVWSLISFTIGLIIVVFLLRPEITNRHLDRNRSSRSQAILWSILGIFMAFAAQYAAAVIEMILFGIEPGSENTEVIVEFAKVTPMFIIVIAVIGPILEEIVFRMVIFGALYKRFNFWIAVLGSSILFAVVHMDFTHLLVYTAMGFVFAYLYVKTKRIIVPIIAHVAINSFVVLVQVVFGERLAELQDQLEQIQSFIGGFFV